MTAYSSRCSSSRTNAYPIRNPQGVLVLHVEQGVHLGQEEGDQGNSAVKQQGQEEKKQLVVGPLCGEIGGYKSQPDDQCGVDTQGDVPGLVEVVGEFAGLDGVDGAEEEQDHVEGEQGDHVVWRKVAGQLDKVLRSHRHDQFDSSREHGKHSQTEHHLKQQGIWKT